MEPGQPVCPINVSQQLRSAPHGGLLGALASNMQVAGDELHRHLSADCYLGSCPRPMDCFVGQLALHVAHFTRRVRRGLQGRKWRRSPELPPALEQRLLALSEDLASGELVPACAALSSQLEGREDEDACESFWEFGMLCYLSFVKATSSRFLDLHAAQLSLAVPRQALPLWSFETELGFERTEILEKLLEGLDADGSPRLAVEIGVWEGETSTVLLHRFPALRMLLVDPYHLNPDATYAANIREGAELKQRFDAASRGMQGFGERARFLLQRSAAAASSVGRASVDLVFADGDHRYAGVRTDLDAWWPKLRPGGLMAGHDYNSRHLGVVLAVNEFAAARGLHLSLAPDFWWFKKPGEAIELGQLPP